MVDRWSSVGPNNYRAIPGFPEYCMDIIGAIRRVDNGRQLNKAHREMVTLRKGVNMKVTISVQDLLKLTFNAVELRMWSKKNV